MDMKINFMNGYLEEDIYIEQSKNFTSGDVITESASYKGPCMD